MNTGNNRSDDSQTAPAGPEPAREVVARLAELFWEKEGRPAGRDLEFRQRAEAELRGNNEPTGDESPS